jgi:DMSO/TMAO reductase YedYZ molybdopterin-dependent catalytic subunit
MENRRDFFKALGIFAAGVVGAKIASYTPKKQEEELQVAESVVVKDKDGNEFNMVVVPKKEEKQQPIAPRSSSFDPNERLRINSNGFATIGSHHQPEAFMIISQNKKPRKLNS